MLRINIEWDFVSPFLKVASGRLYIHEADGIGGTQFPEKLVFESRIKKEEGTLGYKRDPDKDIFLISNEEFEDIKPVIDTMIRSYFDGLTLQKSSVQWLDDRGSNYNVIR